MSTLFQQNILHKGSAHCKDMLHIFLVDVWSLHNRIFHVMVRGHYATTKCPITEHNAHCSEYNAFCIGKPTNSLCMEMPCRSCTVGFWALWLSSHPHAMLSNSIMHSLWGIPLYFRSNPNPLVHTWGFLSLDGLWSSCVHYVHGNHVVRKSLALIIYSAGCLWSRILVTTFGPWVSLEIIELFFKSTGILVGSWLFCLWWVFMKPTCPPDSSGNKNKYRWNMMGWCSYVPTNCCYFRYLLFICVNHLLVFQVFSRHMKI